MVDSGRVPGKGRIRVGTEKGQNQCEYRKIVESGRVPTKDVIRASTEKLPGPKRKNGRISMSIEKLFNPGDYREKGESIRVPKNCPDQYVKMAE